MTDPDIEGIIGALKKDADIVEKKDLSALIALYEGMLQDVPEALATQKKALTEISSKDLETAWRSSHALLSSIDFAALPGMLECKFYEKTEGKTYDRAAVCKLPVTLKKELMETISPSSGKPDAVPNTDLALTTKVALSKIHGVWYAPVDDMVGRFMAALMTAAATSVMEGIKKAVEK